MNGRTPLAIASLAAAMLIGSPARADDEGPAGRVVSLQLNGPGSDDAASFTGKITIRNVKGKRDEYLWGGSACPGQKLTDTQIEILASAMRARTTIVPRYKDDAPPQRCLVAFELRS